MGMNKTPHTTEATMSRSSQRTFEAVAATKKASQPQEASCNLCNGSGYIKSNTIEYEGDCPDLPHPITEEPMTIYPHTPTPYIDMGSVMVALANGEKKTGLRWTDEQKAFIVQAVNAHEAYEELAQVANRIRAVLNDEGKEVLTKAQMEDMLFKAIAKASA
jgi:hypothetical protein